MGFPIVRHRRLRGNEFIRNLVRETKVTQHDLVMPLFVKEGENIKQPITSMPGQFQWSLDTLPEIATRLVERGIQAVLLLGIPNEKDNTGHISCNDNGIVQKAIKLLKEKFPSLYIIADVCCCEYTNHGHCGTIIDGDVENDTTVQILAKQSVSLAKAGVDMIAPSDMMDGRVQTIRSALDFARFKNVPIMSYSVKYASAFYGPFREAAENTPQHGDRKSYQMDYANKKEALREAKSDIEEGADIVMVKPALSYLDIIQDLKNNFDTPVAAYQVSGEYAMIKAASQNGWVDEKKMVLETLTSIKRAGADIIITYFAEEIAEELN